MKVVFFLFVMVNVSFAKYECPTYWLDLGEEFGCFYFARESGDLDWWNAQAYCNRLYEDAYLAEIKSGATQELLAEYADSLPDYHWWLGGTDYFEDGAWRWERNEDIIGFFAWDKDQPDGENYLGDPEDCLLMFSHDRSSKRLWNDSVCSGVTNKRPLCQLFPRPQ
eukprot:07927.XXX_492338_492961_1 [CDS] Oithona nana genome sequencing.